MARIFINFRNFDGDWAALAIRNTLVERFGADEVFLSSFSIRLGADFAAELLERARECDVLLAVIGPRWLTVAGPDGRPKLGAADDWVCREIETAFAAGRTVVPVLLSGADRLSEADLPPRIARLAGLQAYTLNRPRYTADMDGLEEALLTIVPGLTRKQTAAPGPGWTMRVGEVTDRGVAHAISAPAGFDPAGWRDLDVEMDVDRVSGAGSAGILDIRDDPGKTAE